MLAPATPLRDPRYQSLDAWRGLACLMVVVFHSTMYVADGSTAAWDDPASWIIALSKRMWAGVPMFFVISGYCISATADAARLKSRPVSSYFARRLRRIFPPYLILLAIFVPVVGLLDVLVPGLFSDNEYGITRPWWLHPWQWLGTLTLTEGWRHHLVGVEARYFLGHAWTLGYEEQFYAVTGVILLLAARRFFFAAAVVSLAVVALKATRLDFGGFFFDGFWLLFAEGILAYYAIVYCRRPMQWALTLPLLLGLAYAGSNLGELLGEAANGRQHVLVASLFALVILFLHPFDRALAGSPWIAPWVACGRRCYSIYLVHWPICKGLSHALYLAGIDTVEGTVLVTLPACLAASIGAGWLFFHYVERRFLNAPQPAPRSAAPVLLETQLAS